MKFSGEAIKKLREIGVGVVYYFGSRVQGTALDHADYDIGVVFVNTENVTIFPDIFSKLYSILNEYFPDTIRGPKLDISFLQRANPALSMSAIRYGAVLFEASPIFRVNFEEEAVRKYNNYLKIKKVFEEATLKVFS